MFKGVFENSILKRAQEKGVVEIEFIDIRDFGIGKHKSVDDRPYGGGAGMVMRVDVLKNAIEHTLWKNKKYTEKIILLDAAGNTYNQKKAGELAKFDHLIILCGHYEGVDQRIRKYIDEEISVGDYVLTGGEIPAMIIADSIIRLLPGALGKDESSQKESFQEIEIKGKLNALLEHPHYTKPQEFEKEKIPEVLLSGNHKNIEQWRLKEAIKKTKKKRPDLLD